ncbi:hypothetical protein C3432_21285 [Citrobacter amalonaticus]|uniref:Uncharacterized protein n=1 Tax=Citrobacter amalonaticus TaxID=35703 RepID=A0A2S4RV41_CITAM|nr:hypothetical protein C3432_21285 [Citrobacter amalonaticus]POT73790.1 hypothetical protein C3436_18750 [Citrobacter amalonaticus]POU64015.1 hypothetical protein C3430_17685 [Citrobacter amalonaticus]POV03648.1 hypothetical protein C3424_20600 [Citrobacter amalonaticus]
MENDVSKQEILVCYFIVNFITFNLSPAMARTNNNTMIFIIFQTMHAPYAAKSYDYRTLMKQERLPGRDFGVLIK